MSLPDPEEHKLSWYTRDGEAVYDVGLREARKNRLIPRVSHVIETVYSGERFALQSAAELARDDPSASITDVVNRSAQYGTSESRHGTECHTAIERFARQMAPAWERDGDDELMVFYRLTPPTIAPYVAPAITRLIERVGAVVGVEHTIVSPEGYAGTIDLIHETGKVEPRGNRRRRVEFVDYKSQGARLAPQRKWLLQFGAYADAWRAVYGYYPTTCVNLIFSRVEPGKIRPVVHADIKGMVRAWRHCWALWQWVNKWEGG